MSSSTFEEGNRFVPQRVSKGLQALGQGVQGDGSPPANKRYILPLSSFLYLFSVFAGDLFFFV